LAEKQRRLRVKIASQLWGRGERLGTGGFRQRFVRGNDGGIDMLESDYRLLRAVAGQFLMGALMGVFLVVVVVSSDAGAIATMIAGGSYPQMTMAVLAGGLILNFAFGAAITGFVLHVSEW